ncbi:MAG: hypothetical protein QMC98_03790 [Candidatus Thermoplasmatota archaeon]|nr:hypothetical protein [Candidatus Thermoplasmatota archaeon]
MKKYICFGLLAVLVISITIRLLPLFNYSIWGSDTGEYYELTKRVVEKGALSFDYKGWGFCYPYFPGMFSLVGSASLLLSSNLLTTLLIIIPVISSLSVILVFLITNEIFKDMNAGLISALLLSVAIPHVFTTSHTMPGSLGDFLFILCMLLFIKSYQSRNFLMLFFVAVIALVITHHLSSYFLMIALALFIFLRELSNTKTNFKELKFDLLAVGFLLLANITYWLYAAGPFREIIKDAFDLTIENLLLFGLVAFVIMVLLIKLRRKFLLRERKIAIPSYRRILITYCSGLIVGFAVLFISVFLKFPGTTIQIDKIAILLFSPSIIIFCLAVFGNAFAPFYRKAMLLFCWLLAVALSFFLGIATSNTVLISYRHLQYLIVPLAIFAGFGAAKFIELSKRKKTATTFLACLLAFLIILAPFSCYPSKAVLGGFEEGTPLQNINSIVWSKEYLANEPVASDHRLSSMLFGFANCRASWEFTPKIFHVSSFSDAKDELENAAIPSGKTRINYIVIDEIMKEGVCLKQWEPAIAMSDESLKKFEKEPFIKIYDDGFTQVYKIAWC